MTAPARGRYGGRVGGLTATVARLKGSPFWLDLGLAIVLTIADELEVLLGAVITGASAVCGQSRSAFSYHRTLGLSGLRSTLDTTAGRVARPTTALRGVWTSVGEQRGQLVALACPQVWRSPPVIGLGFVLSDARAGVQGSSPGARRR